jgi:RNA recognition motif-containing protein
MPGRDECKVCVKNFPPGTPESDLKDFFSSAGEVIDVFAREGRDGWFAFVGYNTETERDSALKLNGREFQGAALSVEAKQIKKCFKCGKEGHVSAKCPRGDERVCFNCNRPGHLSRDCTSAPGDRRRDRSPQRDRSPRRDRSRDRSRRDRSRRSRSRRSRSRSPKRARR